MRVRRFRWYPGGGGLQDLWVYAVDGGGHGVWGVWSMGDMGTDLGVKAIDRGAACGGSAGWMP